MVRSLSVTYTEQEIQQWREARRKNYPSKNNFEKKQSGRQNGSKVVNREDLRRELKEILAKQAALGVEVAEIPTHYLRDPQNNCVKGEEKRNFANKRKFQNKFDRRTDRQDQYSNKQKIAKKNFPNAPTLLQKLLSADIRRDKRHLFQAFRFMRASFCEEDAARIVYLRLIFQLINPTNLPAFIRFSGLVMSTKCFRFLPFHSFISYNLPNYSLLKGWDDEELGEEQRSDAVSSMVYEAKARMRDPVYGCVGAISSLQQQVDELQTQLAQAQAEVLHMRVMATQSPLPLPNSNSSSTNSFFPIHIPDSFWSC
ncbi:nuclear fragile X mental retardation-interacting protein [Senna tora]|uniref:Nuclear fragile X mental retardation-interacting protein n=1 Tax=Senna tora TaxID=362788 RepID=A0A834THV2_9FABA|nr:nuclear fragile X mental retardation-interacting protein [Senna tora]